MRWYENILFELEDGKKYTHKELVEMLRKHKGFLSESSYHWAISTLISNHLLLRRGYNSYSLSKGEALTVYKPFYTDLAKELIELIGEQYPYVIFTVFETVLMNEFLNHLIARNTIFLQVEKDCGIFVFRYLQEKGYQNVLYKPSERDLDLYWEADSIIVTDFISEAPLNRESPHEVLIEKMLVDMYVDKLISRRYNRSEYRDVIEQVDKKYCLDKPKMLRYARRRNRHKDIERFLKNTN